MTEPAKSVRAERLAELNRQIRALHDQIAPLAAERAYLESEQAREEFPDGPFSIIVWRHHTKGDEGSFDRPLDALRHAEYIEDAGSGSTEAVVDRHGNVIYDLDDYPYKRVAEGYPEVPDDL